MTRPLTLAALLLTAVLALAACVSQRSSVDTTAARRRAAPHIEQATTNMGRLAAAVERMAADLDRAAASIRVYPSLRHSVADYHSTTRQLRTAAAGMHRVADILRSPRGSAMTPAEMRKFAAVSRQASVDALASMAEAASGARRELSAANVPAAMAADLEQVVINFERAIDEGAAAGEYASAVADNLERAAEAWEARLPISRRRRQAPLPGGPVAAPPGGGGRPRQLLNEPHELAEHTSQRSAATGLSYWRFCWGNVRRCLLTDFWSCRPSVPILREGAIRREAMSSSSPNTRPATARTGRL